MSKNNLPSIQDVTGLAGKKVLLRAALDVPVENGSVVNTFRLTEGLRTIHFLIEQNACVIIAGHIGRDPELTLRPVYEAFKEHITLTYVEDIVGEQATKAVHAMQPGDVILLENLRQDEREKDNDAAFSKSLAGLADLYVDDAFSVAHREHASIVGVPKYIPGYAGINFAHEYTELHKAMQPESPALFLLGGAKFETKMPLVEKFLDIYDHVFVGGALANDFFKGLGYEVGTSLISDVDLTNSPLLTHPKILLPTDVTVSGPGGVRVTSPQDVQEDEIIFDAGPKTVQMLETYITGAKMILWNGPFGNYEGGFAEASEGTAKLIAEADGYSVIGGGDTIAVIENLNLNEKFSFLSTAGGAMLSYLEFGSLPGIDVLKGDT